MQQRLAADEYAAVLQILEPFCFIPPIREAFVA